VRLLLVPEQPMGEIRHDGARAEHNPLLRQELEGDGRLRETLLGEEGRVREHQIETLAHLTRNVQGRAVVVKHKVAAVHGEAGIEFEHFERDINGVVALCQKLFEMFVECGGRHAGNAAFIAHNFEDHPKRTKGDHSKNNHVEVETILDPVGSGCEPLSHI